MKLSVPRLLDKYFILPAVALVISIPLLGLASTTLVTSIYIAYLLTGYYIPDKSILQSRFFKLMVALTYYSIILQFIVMAVWLVNKDFPLNLVIYITFATMLSLLMSKLFRRNRTQEFIKPDKLFGKADIAALCVAAIMIGMIVVGPIRNSLTSLKRLDYRSVAIDLINTSLDDVSHLSRVNDRLHLNRGVIYGSTAANKVTLQNTVSTYPPGWHSANAVVIKAIYPSIKIGDQSAVAYLITKLFWFTTLIYFFVIFTVRLRRTVSGDKTGAHDWSLTDTVTVGISAFFVYYTLLENFISGFYNFIPVLIYLVLMGLIYAYRDTETGRQPGNKTFVAIFTLMVGASTSWSLMVPAFVLVSIVLWLYGDTRKKVYKNFQHLLKAIYRNLAPTLLGFIAMGAQVILLLASTSRSFSSGVNDPGAITKHSIWYSVFIVVGIIIALTLAARRVRLEQLLALLVGLLMCAGFVYVFQMVTALRPEYYYTKSLYAAFIIALPLAIAGCMQLYARATAGKSLLHSALVGLLLLVAIPLSIGIDPTNTSGVAYVIGRRWFTPRENVMFYSEIPSLYRLNEQGKVAYTFTYQPEDMGYVIAGSNLINSVQPRGDCYELVYAKLSKTEAKPLDLSNSCNNVVIKIFTRRQYIKDLSQLALPNNYTAIATDTP